MEANCKFLLGTCYIPSTSSVNVYTAHTEVVNSLFSLFDDNKSLTLASDYDLLGVQFFSDDLAFIYPGFNSPVADMITEHFSFLNFYQN